MRVSEKLAILIGCADSPPNLTIASIKNVKDVDIKTVHMSQLHPKNLKSSETALIIFDGTISHEQQIQAAERLRQKRNSASIPLLFITQPESISTRLFKGHEKGLFDFVNKDFNPQIITNKIHLIVAQFKQKKEHDKALQNFKLTMGEMEQSKAIIEKQNKMLSHLSIRDGLTNLYNHRYMDEILEKEFNRAKRYSTDLSCMLLDLDFFKEVNDTCGHQFGDFVLKELGHLLRGYIRESDYPFRYGGEEFMALLPSTDIQGAQNTAEKFREICENKIYEIDDNITMLTISIGVSSIKHNKVEIAKDLISFADKALYQAKAEGRNRVIVYQKDDKGAKKNKKSTHTQDIKYLKDNLAAILDKTKRASVASLELLVREMGGKKFKEHNRNVIKSLDIMGSKLKLPPRIVNKFKLAATFHDCFKILIEAKLHVKTQALTEEEKTIIEDHPYMLAELTELFDFFSDERSVLLYHHERFDGDGYPEGLEGGEIPLGARIFAIVDAFVAMTSKRAYRETLSFDKALQELITNSGTQFDPMLVSLFIDAVKESDIDEKVNLI